MTSSAVVRPAITLRVPSSRKVRIPISRARARKTLLTTKWGRPSTHPFGTGYGLFFERGEKPANTKP